MRAPEALRTWLAMQDGSAWRTWLAMQDRSTRHDVLKRGVAAGRSAQRACERSSDWRRGAAGSPDPDKCKATQLRGLPDPYEFKGMSQYRSSGSPLLSRGWLLRRPAAG